MPRRTWAKVSSAGSVLIIDDEAAIRESLETLLEMEGYDVQSAATADEGLAGSASAPSTWSCSTWRCPIATASICWRNFTLTIRSWRSS